MLRADSQWVHVHAVEMTADGEWCPTAMCCVGLPQRRTSDLSEQELWVIAACGMFGLHLLTARSGPGNTNTTVISSSCSLCGENGRGGNSLQALCIFQVLLRNTFRFFFFFFKWELIVTEIEKSQRCLCSFVLRWFSVSPLLAVQSFFF